MRTGEVGDGLNHKLLCLNLLDSGWFDDEVSVVRRYVGASRRIARKGSLCLQQIIYNGGFFMSGG